jgi:hypothetical protein
MDADNPAPAFRVTLKARIGACTEDATARCVNFTVTTDRPCHLILLTRDPNGEVSLLLPKRGEQVRETCPHVEAGATIIPPAGAGYEFPVQPPYGRTWFKVIATTRMVDFVEPANPASAGAAGGAAGEIEGLRTSVMGVTAGALRQEQEIAKLLGPDEWATAEADLLTIADGGTANGGGGPIASPR